MPLSFIHLFECLLTEDPEDAYYNGRLASYKNADAVTFGWVDGKLVWGMNGNSPWWLNSLTDLDDFTHTKLAILHSPNMEQIKDAWETAQKDGSYFKLNALKREAQSRLKTTGRGWVRDDAVLVSFWTPTSYWHAPVKEVVREAAEVVAKANHSSLAGKKILWQDIDMGMGEWHEVEDDVKQSGNITPEDEALLRELQKGIHVAPPEEKARIRAEMAKIMGRSTNVGWGSSKAGKRAHDAGFGSAAAFNAARAVGESKLPKEKRSKDLPRWVGRFPVGKDTKDLPRYKGKLVLGKDTKDLLRGQILESEKAITLYRGVSVHQASSPKGWFYSPDIEFARQFTQSGRAHEILKLSLEADSVYYSDPLPYGGDPDEVDAAIERALEVGKFAVACDEGGGEPPSIFVLKRAIAQRKAKILGRAVEDELLR